MRKLSKKALSLILSMMMILSVASGIGALAAREYAADVSILGTTVDLKNPAYAYKDRIFVPLEELACYMNVSVERQGGIITVQRGSTTAVVTAGNMICTVDGTEVTLSYQPVDKNGVVYVPVDFFSTAFAIPVSVSVDFRSADIAPNTYKIAIKENDAAGVKASRPEEDTLVTTTGGNDQLFWNQEKFPDMLTAVYYKADLSEFNDIESASLCVNVARRSSYNPYVTVIRTAPWEKGNISFNNRPEEFAETARITLSNSATTVKVYVNREADVTSLVKAAMAEGTSLYVKLNGTPHASKVTDDTICAGVMGVNTKSAPYLLVKVKENYSFPVKTVEAEASGKEFSYSKMGILRSLGVFTENDEFPLDMKESVQRQEFVKYALRMRNAQPASGDSTQFFSDVPVDAPFYNDVMTAHSLGLVSGWEGVAFRPYDEITVGEAITIMGRMLNYNIYADERGGFSPGYFAAARQGDLYLGTSTETQPLSFAKMISLLEDALEAKMLDVVSYRSDGSAEYIFNEDMTILTEFWNAEVIEGTVTANEYSNLVPGIDGKEGTIVIASKKLKLNYKPYNDFLGYKVKAYYEKDEEVLLYMGIKESDITDIDISDIEGVSETSSALSVSYLKENNKKTTETINKTGTVIYNGKTVSPENVTVALIDSGCGNIRLVGDNLAIITEYDIIVVSAVDSTEELIHDEYDPYDRLLRLKNTDYIFSDINGQDIALENIKKNDVVSVAKSLDGKIVSGIVSSTKLTGAITMTDNSDGDLILTIAGREYELRNTRRVSESEEYWTDHVKLGLQAIFLVDSFGNIAGLIVQDKTDVLGYLLDLDYSGNSLSKKLQAAVVIKEAEEYVVYDLADKVEVDGGKISNHADIATYFTETVEVKDEDGNVTDTYEQIKRQPIIFDLNAEGKISGIDTAQLGSAESKESTLNQRYTFADTQLRYKGNGTYGGQFFIGRGDGMIVAKGGEEYEDYIVRKSLSNDEKYSVEIYTIGTKTPEALFTIVEETTTPGIGDDNLYYVADRITVAYDSDGYEVKKLYYHSGVDSIKSVIINDKYETAVADLNRGDIFRFSTDAHGKLHAAKEYYDFETKSFASGIGLGSFNATGRVSAGYVTRVDKSYVQLSNDADLSNPASVTWHDGSRFKNLMSYTVDSSGVQVKAETVDSIRSFENVPFNPQGMIILSTYENYRNNVWLVDMNQPEGTGAYTLTYSLGEGGASYGEVPNTPTRCNSSNSIPITDKVPNGKKDVVNNIAYEFSHWEDEDGNTVSGTIYLTKNTVLTAQWNVIELPRYIYLKESKESGEQQGEIIVYKENGSYMTIVPNATKDDGSYYFTQTGFGYYNWIDEEGTEYNPGVSLILAEDLTLYPNWKPIMEQEFDISKFTVLKITENEGTQTAASQSTSATMSVGNIWLLVKVAVGENWKMDATTVKLTTTTGGNKAIDSNGYYVPISKEAWLDAVDGTIASPLTKPSAVTVAKSVKIRAASGTGSFSEVSKTATFATPTCSSSYDGENLYFAIELENAGVGASKWAKWKLAISGLKKDN